MNINNMEKVAKSEPVGKLPEGILEDDSLMSESDKELLVKVRNGIEQSIHDKVGKIREDLINLEQLTFLKYGKALQKAKEVREKHNPEEGKAEVVIAMARATLGDDIEALKRKIKNLSIN